MRRYVNEISEIYRLAKKFKNITRVKLSQVGEIWSKEATRRAQDKVTNK